MDSKIKVILILAAVVIIGFGLLKITDSISTEGHAVLNEQPNIDEQAADEQTADEPQPTGQIQQQETKEFAIKASQWKFEPSTITVNKGDVVRITAESMDVPHGFAIDEYGINLYLDGTTPKTAEFVADMAGTFTFYCNVLCGAGHSAMRGQLIVRE